MDASAGDDAAYETQAIRRVGTHPRTDRQPLAAIEATSEGDPRPPFRRALVRCRKAPAAPAAHIRSQGTRAKDASDSAISSDDALGRWLARREAHTRAAEEAAMTLLALAGDTMLGRGVAERISIAGPAAIWGSALPLLWSADLLCVNLECALTTHAQPWLDGARKAFYFRAHPTAVEALHVAGVDFVSLANNHVLDFREDGLRDTLRTLDRAGIAHAGAGTDIESAARPAYLSTDGIRIGIVAFADHPAEWAATASRPGVDLVRASSGRDELSRVRRALSTARAHADLVVLSLHWGPNMRERPSPQFREFARAAVDAGADVVWGHSAHVVQGIEFHAGRPILYDTGELIDDYAVDPELRNDLGALFLLRVSGRHIEEVALAPLRIDDMRLERATAADRALFTRRFTSLCGELGTEIAAAGDQLIARPRQAEIVAR